ncbi:fucolectin-5-like [Mercenaria mercenaria]|uniref:fucolectin-5-like n=1 Tax=Mercenaria mercenaria TaxID=6596 RepID=UPI00234E4F39|nr:fucolectin-5-like [Mercenaria mercenaria]
MYTFSKTLLYTIFVAFFAILTVAVNVQFVRYQTGFNPILNNFEMQSTVTCSRTECGSLCEVMGCTSFIFQETQKLCTLYSVYMTYDDGDVLDKYYVRSDAEEHVTEAAERCSGVNIPSTSTNVALNKDVTISSQHNSLSPPRLMVDGSRSGSWPCASTGLVTNPHTTVDLWQSFEINALYIVNRVDCCSERLHHLVVKIGNDMSNLQTAFNHTNAVGADCTVIFDTPRRGRYVRLQIEATEYLTVCELEVYSLV